METYAPSPFKPIVYGKLPDRGDFFKSCGSQAAATASEWVHKVYESAIVGQKPEWMGSLRGWLALERRAAKYLFAMVPSEDSVGRRFPLSIFAPVSLSSGARDLPGLLQDVTPALEATVSVAYDLASGFAPDVATTLHDLEQATRTGDARDTVVEKLPVTERALGDVHAALFPNHPDPMTMAYAVAMMSEAVKMVEGGGSAAKTCVLRGPVENQEQRLMWLALIRSTLPRSGAVDAAVVWSSEPENMLAVGLGEPGPQVLVAALTNKLRNRQVWPLHPETPDAVSSVAGLCSPGVLACLKDPQGSLGGLCREVEAWCKA